MRSGLLRQVILYGMIGALSTTIDFVLFAVLTHGCFLHYQLANAISVFVSLGNGFLLNYHFNFGVRGRFWTRMLMFYVIGMFGWLMAAVQLCVYVEWLRVSELVAKMAAIIVCMVLQFLLNKFWTFGRGGDNGSL